MKKKYVVHLTEAERQALEVLVRAGTGRPLVAPTLRDSSGLMRAIMAPA